MQRLEKGVGVNILFITHCCSFNILLKKLNIKKIDIYLKQKPQIWLVPFVGSNGIEIYENVYNIQKKGFVPILQKIMNLKCLVKNSLHRSW